MQNSAVKTAFLSILLLCGCLSVIGQSGDLNFPTPVRSNVIEGTIPARAMGDSRMTSYFYTFEGGQGDIFINVVTTNLTGDIDVYTADSLQPLTKIVVYDPGVNETGRLIYLRRPQRLILRVQGRTPNDDTASFRIKFAGSFSASALPDVEDAPKLDRGSERAEVKADTAETITPADREPAARQRVEKEEESERSTSALRPESRKNSEDVGTGRPSEVRTVFGNRSTRSRTPAKPGAADTKPAAAPRNRRTSPDPPSRTVKSSDPLASIRLVIETKDGGVIEHPMSEVVRFSVDRGVLTLVTKSGKTNRYSILNVEKVTIQ